jgi:hypothetical protein
MKGLAVMIAGVLRGMGCETNCEVLARKQSPDLGPEYSEAFILNAPADLPEGEYLVMFDGHTLRATKAHGLWLPSSEIAREPQ